jgi:Lon protease-like protein
MNSPPDSRFLRLFPLESVVLFPGIELPLVVFEPRYRQLTQECLDTGEPFGVLLLRSGSEVGSAESLPHQVGTTAHIQRVEELGDGRLRILAVGRHRFRVTSFDHTHPYLAAQVDYLPKDSGVATPPMLVDQVKQLCTKYVQALMALRGGYVRAVMLPDSAEDLSHLAALLLQGQRDLQQQLLEMDSAADRLTKNSEWLSEALEEARSQAQQRWAEQGFSVN